MTAHERAANIKLIAFDIDGVMTDGKLYYTDDGRELKAFNTQDGQGLRFLQQAGVALAIITGRTSGAVAARAKNLDIHHLFQGVSDKHACMSALLAQLGLDWSEAAYMGDDVVDLPTMQACAFSAAPDNAHPTVRAKANFVTAHRGGEGAVREVCDLILAARQGNSHA
ncbi:3-deoxy-D-manno-octulosonate 8-phosphate phosphatase [Betaproteobacteria bacterium]|nr:3-deoxy-D-manno-octulosonate 8-phosphate phosphatase [Betaproteobacteria bacterium]GHU46265.1 3-deoxy-D-manno-octulosonate 8-phosphate phosphatase [Betaproteobacteria bacterium]